MHIGFVYVNCKASRIKWKNSEQESESGGKGDLMFYWQESMAGCMTDLLFINKQLANCLNDNRGLTETILWGILGYTSYKHPNKSLLVWRSTGQCAHGIDSPIIPVLTSRAAWRERTVPTLPHVQGSVFKIQSEWERGWGRVWRGWRAPSLPLKHKLLKERGGRTWTASRNSPILCGCQHFSSLCLFQL